ncbi:MAG TPA: hypothetical protein VHW05_15690 [Phenylobacterium sp.]|nr:hypothetical protein [Phenylobacterium sp.]
MKKTLTAALAALTLGGAITATAATGAEARPYGHGGGHYYGHGYRGGGGAVAAGIAGLAIGAAIAGPHYYGGYYGPGPYAYGPGYYGTCYTTRWVWDGYGRRVPVREAYAC